MADRVKCPRCYEWCDARGFNSHMRYSHDINGATKADAAEVQTMPQTNGAIVENSNGKQVSEANGAGEVLEKIENGQELVGVADNAIVFRNEIIITDPEIKERVADALVESMGGRF